MITPALPSNLANAVTPYSPVGKLAVGEENIEARNTPFKPVEETAHTHRQENRASNAERAAEAEERVDFESRSSSENESRYKEEEQKQEAQKEQQREQQRLDQQLIDELAKRDREVRAHEQAHNAVGGQLTGSPSYRYQRGPDGVSYAVAGEVSISLGSANGDPEVSLQVARTVKRAALAPADPSTQDRRVAAAAAQVERQALQEIALKAREERTRVKEEAEAESAERELQPGNEVNNNDSVQRGQNAEDESLFRSSAVDSISQNVDINRRLVDIGVLPSPSPIGGLLNLNA